MVLPLRFMGWFSKRHDNAMGYAGGAAVGGNVSGSGRAFFRTK
jgi:hypothetical protein